MFLFGYILLKDISLGLHNICCSMLEKDDIVDIVKCNKIF